MSHSRAISEAREAPFVITYCVGDDVETIWPQVFEMIASACDETITPRQIFDDMKDHKALMWLVNDDKGIASATVTRIAEANGNRWLEVLVTGGRDMAMWLEAISAAMIAYKRQTKCDFIRTYCRRGLSKKLKPLGWRERQVIMEYRDDGR